MASLTITRQVQVTAQAAVPSYLAGMSDWAVRSLVPSGSAPEARYCYPTEWRNGTTGGVPLTFNNPEWPDYAEGADGRTWNVDFYNAASMPSQSGTVTDLANKKLYHHGGGHAGGPFNGITCFDFSGDAAPVGWSYVQGSASSTLYQADPNAWEISYPERETDPGYFIPFAGPPRTKPVAVHTGNQHVFVPSRNRYYRFGGASFGKGQTEGTSAFYWEFAAAQWYEIPAFSSYNMQFPAEAKLSPDQSKVFVWSSKGAGDFFVRLADTPAGHQLIPARATYMPDSEPNPLVCRNEDTGEYFALAYGVASDRLVRGWTDTIDWTNETASAVEATLNVNKTWNDVEAFSPMNASMFYDQANGCFWVVGDRPPGYKAAAPYVNTVFWLWKILRVSATEYTFSKVVLPTPIEHAPLSPSGAVGLQGRNVWIEEWRTLLISSHNYKPVYALKIPTGI